MHVPAEHLIPLVADHLKPGPVDEDAVPLAVYAVHALADRVQKRSSLYLRLLGSLGEAGCLGRRLPQLDLGDDRCRNILQGRDLDRRPFPGLCVYDAEASENLSRRKGERNASIGDDAQFSYS